MEKKEEKPFVPLRNQGRGTSTTSKYTTLTGQDYGKSFNKYNETYTMNLQELENLRWKNGLEVDGENCPAPFMSFQETGIGIQLLDHLKRKGIETPTPIQMQGISCLNNGRDVIGIAPTGSGKTLAYLLPIISTLSRIREPMDNRGPFALIVVPTRELMQQIVEISQEMLQLFNFAPGKSEHQLHTPSVVPPPHQMGATLTSNMTTISTASLEYNYYSGINQEPYGPQVIRSNISNTSNSQHNSFVRPYFPGIFTTAPAEIPYFTDSNIYQPVVAGFCGGIRISENIEILQSNKVAIVVATPGRLIDLTDRGFISYDNTTSIVLDECDKMLDMGMEEQLRKIVSQITVEEKQRQFSLWSATLPEALERLARSAVVDPVVVHVGVRDFICPNITQDVIFIHTYQKQEMLLKTLRSTPYPPVIVFASTKDTVDEITSLLVEEQFHVCGLHSNKCQEYRFKVMSAFRRGKVDVLVATDLASRGLDIPEVTHVINYDIPDTIEDYIHRCGRTGRFGRPGLATSFLTLTCKIAEELKELLELSQMPIPKQLEDTKQFGGKVIITQFGDRLSL